VPKFIPGLQLCEGFYVDAVEPILARVYPELRYSAGLIGPGSEVLGLDTETSTDHGWGPRVQLFVDKETHRTLRKDVQKTLADNLPYTYKGYSTSFQDADPEAGPVTHMVPKISGPVDHMIEVLVPREYSKRQLGADATKGLSATDWLAISQHHLLTMTSGKLFRDDLDVAAMRKNLEYFPRDHWIFLMGCCWWRMRRWEQQIGRAGQMEDELSAKLLAAKIVQDLMRLAFLMERKYIPYTKWQGAVFRKLDCGPELGPHLDAMLAATGWLDRDRALVNSLETVARMHNDLRVTPRMNDKCVLFPMRTYHHMDCDVFGRTLFGQVMSKPLSNLFRQGVPGSIDIIIDSMDMHVSSITHGKVRKLFKVD